jgi:hypothetical protein
MSAEPSKEKELSIRDLFPDLSEEQLKEVEETFHGYLEVAWRIYERLEREQPDFFDRFKGPSYHEGKVDSSLNKN